VAQPQPAAPAAPAIESGPSAYPTQCPAEGQKISVAIYPIKPAGADASLAQAMTALLSSQLTPSPQLKVIEEAMLKAVMERQGLNASDACDDTSCQVDIGKLVKAQKMIAGDLVKFGSKFVLSLKLIDIQTGTTEFSTEDKCSCTEDQLDQLIAVAAAKVRNHFCEKVALPALPQGQSFLPAPAIPLSSGPHLPNVASASVSPGKAKIYIYYKQESGNTIGSNKTVCVPIDGSCANEILIHLNQCLVLPIAAGDHRIGGQYDPKILLSVEAGKKYFVEMRTSGFYSYHWGFDLVSEDQARSWLSSCGSGEASP
jgi:hypothetical protein